MNELRLKELLEQIQSGKLSRNKNFDAFKEPAVRDARDRSYRINALQTLILEGQLSNLKVARDEQEQRWQLSFHFAQFDFIWSAFLYDVEVSQLIENEPVRKEIASYPDAALLHTFTLSR